MGRRKRQLLEDDFSDSSGSDDHSFDDPNEDADAKEERALFENPYKRKKRRKDGKEDSIYGVFASSDEDEGFSGKAKEARQRRDWTKAPAFVSKQTLDLTKEMDVDEQGTGGISSEGSEPDDEAVVSDLQEQSGSEKVSKSSSPRVREEQEEQEEGRPRFGGIGSKKPTELTSSTFSGFSRGGIGSFKPSTLTDASIVPAPSPPPPSVTAEADFPSAFGSSSRTQRSFLRNDDSASGNNSPRSATPLSSAEAAHFSKLGGSFGARMLGKMGWKAGMGLGVTGEGIAAPVESKLRPKGMGLAFKGFREKTEQSKVEARRRGEVVSDDEETPKAKKKGKKGIGKGETSDAWKKAKKVRVKVEHKTYEQIIAEAGEEAPPAIGQIIDATGATPREVASIADLSLASWTPTTEPMRLPELRHNLRLINEACKSDLDGLAREAKALGERKKWIHEEDLRLRKKVDEEAELISRLQQVHLVVNDINTQAKEMASMYEASLDAFSVNFDKLLGLYPKEFDRYRLDEIVVAAIAPIFRRVLAQWQPLQDPTAFTATFKQWRRAFKLSSVEEKPPESQIQVYGSSMVVAPVVVIEKPMTPYESLIWNAWLPKVRSAINNEWSPEDPQPAVRLYEAWSSLLPPFVRDNFFDQLILPKVHQSVGDWNPRNHKVSLQTLVFPWLPLIGLRLEEVLGDARRKVKSLLRNWVVADGMPQDLLVWKDVFGAGDWDTMLLKYVVPKLGARLRDDFRINPRKQDMEPLKDVLLWDHILRPSVFSQLIEKEFFPKWLDVLHVWLIQPKPSFEEVSRWYREWKGTFTEDVQNMSGITNGFTRGLQLMNKAMELGPDAPTKLPRPDHHLLSTSPTVNATRQAAVKPRPVRTQEITFRSIVEDFASTHNLLFIPIGRAHEVSRMPLFRVSQTVDGKGGLLVYIQDDAVWAPDGDQYRAIALEDMVLRAMKG